MARVSAPFSAKCWLDAHAIIHNYHQLLAYLDLPWIKALQLPNFPSSSSGAKHFYEVKRLFLFNYAVLLVTFVPSLTHIKAAISAKNDLAIYSPDSVDRIGVCGYVVFDGDWF